MECLDDLNHKLLNSFIFLKSIVNDSTLVMIWLLNAIQDILLLYSIKMYGIIEYPFV